jgi:hypothetical protein
MNILKKIDKYTNRIQKKHGKKRFGEELTPVLLVRIFLTMDTFFTAFFIFRAVLSLLSTISGKAGKEYFYEFKCGIRMHSHV